MSDNTKEKSEYPKTPTLDKMLENKEQSQSIGSFLDWLQTEKEILFYTREPERIEYFDKEFEKEVNMLGENTPVGAALRWDNPTKWAIGGGLVSHAMHIEKLLAEYFKVDLKKAEDERRAVLEHCRKSALQQK